MQDPPHPDPSLPAEGDNGKSAPVFSAWIYVREGAELAWPRFWARLIDVVFWSILFGVVAVPIILFFPMIPEFVVFSLGLLLYAFVEAAILMSFAATPGKWVMGLSVTDADGAPLSYGPALRRSLDVYLRGMGLGIPFLQLICWAIGYDRLRKHDVMWWDAREESRVSGPEVHGWKKILSVVLVTAVLVLWLGSGVLQVLSETGA